PYAVQLALDALAWRTLLGGLGHRVPWKKLFGVRLASEAVLLTVPGGSFVGESLKPYLLRRVAEVPLPRAVASISVKRALLAGAQAMSLALAVIVGHDALASANLVDGLPWLVGGASMLLLLVAIGLGLALSHGKIASRIRRALATFPSRRLRAALEARREG